MDMNPLMEAPDIQHETVLEAILPDGTLVRVKASHFYDVVGTVEARALKLFQIHDASDRRVADFLDTTVYRARFWLQKEPKNPSCIQIISFEERLKSA